MRHCATLCCCTAGRSEGAGGKCGRDCWTAFCGDRSYLLKIRRMLLSVILGHRDIDRRIDGRRLYPHRMFLLLGKEDLMTLSGTAVTRNSNNNNNNISGL